MNKGVLVFAHNSRQIDYAKIAMVCGSLAKKNLNVPVSLATDSSTVEWMKESKIFKKASEIFDKIIITEPPLSNQNRTFSDGTEKIIAPFRNSNRNSVWNITPYDRTLLVDCDYFIFSDTLNNFWDVDSDILISNKYNDVYGDDRIGYLDKFVSETSVKLLWATTVMFSKNENTKIFFDLVEYIRENYTLFADTYRFDNRLYRNDISFSIARHIMYGYETDDDYALPPVLSVPDKDILYDADETGLTFLVSQHLDKNYFATKIKGRDIHIMNKQSITRNIDKLMELA